MNFSTVNPATLKINVACEVMVVPFVEDGATIGANKVKVDIEGEGVEVSQSGDVISITHGSLNDIANIVIGDIYGGSHITNELNNGSVFI
jgi:hypothetical protein